MVQQIPAVCQVTLGLNPVSVAAAQASVHQVEFGHEVAVVKLRDVDAAELRFSTGSSALLVYGYANKTRTFVGYVNTVEPIYDPVADPANPRWTEVTLIGPTGLLRTQQNRIYLTTTAPDVVASLATSYRLSAVVHGHGQLWDSLSSARMTDWQFLVDLAHKLGWAMWPVNTTIFFMPYDLLLSPSVVPVFTEEAASGGSLRQWHPQMTETDPWMTKAVRSLATLDMRTLATATATDGRVVTARLGEVDVTPAYSRLDTTDVAHTLTEAAYRVQAEGAEHRWHLRAKATVSGNPRVGVGSLVRMQPKEERSRGLWFVRGVTHRFRNQSYTQELDLGRDAQFDTRILDRRRDLDLVEVNPIGFALPRTPDAALFEGIWQSSQGVVAYV